MVFSSLIFIIYFLPITFLLHYYFPKYRNIILFISSVIFYTWGEIKYFPAIITIVVANYIFARIIESSKHKRIILIFSIIFNLGFLCIFKYFNFFINTLNLIFSTNIPLLMSLSLPLGISFYTFQTMSYTIDVFRGNTKAEKNIIDLGTYIILFPQLIAGPIVLYKDIKESLKNRVITNENIKNGIQYFIFGLSSKVLIANNVGALWDSIQIKQFSNISILSAWLAIISYTLQIYFDFSGYSLMAIGMGKMLGFEFPKNFDYPYESKSITEFWRKWHITLSSWFREYLYIPLGGNKCSKTKNIINLFIVWSLTGLWHGAAYNFIIWGIYYFILLIIEKYFLLIKFNNTFIKHFITMFFVSIGWGIFGVNNFIELKNLFISLFSYNLNYDFIYYLRNYFIIILLGFIFSTHFPAKIYYKINKKFKIILLSILFIICISYLVDSTYNPFLYFRF